MACKMMRSDQIRLIQPSIRPFWHHPTENPTVLMHSSVHPTKNSLNNEIKQLNYDIWKENKRAQRRARIAATTIVCGIRD